MPLALILSSFVSASRIGGAVQQYVLAAHKIDPVLAPTVMFGRSPAKGGAGEVTPPEVLRRMMADIEADAIFGLVDLVITGHFSSPEQVEVAAGVLERVRRADREGAFTGKPVVVVDPIMGDAPKGLYVSPEVAAAVAGRLVPLADWITPNVWELGRLADAEVRNAHDAVQAVRRLGTRALVTSVPDAQDIGLLFVDATRATLFSHPRLEEAPDGTGDLVTASFGAGLVEGLDPLAAAERAARAAAETVKAGDLWNAPELPIVALGERLVRPTAEVRIERL